MEVIACECDGLPAHSHTPERLEVRFSSGHTATVRRDLLELNPDLDVEIVSEIPSSIRLWVDWKAVARDLMTL